MLVREQAVAVEALDVVALVGRSVAPDVDAVRRHLLDEQRAGHGASERRRVEVAAPSGLDVERAALQRGQRFAHERSLAVDEHRILRAVAQRPGGHGLDVWLVVLPEVRGERVGHGTVLAHPRDRAAGVEAARERDADALADRERTQDRTAGGRRRLGDAHSPPPSMQRVQFLRNLASGVRFAGRDEDRVVTSDRAGHLRQPGAVDRVRERNGDAARRLDDDDRPRRCERARPAAQRGGQLVAVPEIGGPGEGVDEPSVRGAHLRGRVAPRRATPSPGRCRSLRRAVRRRSSVCVESCCCCTRRRIAPWRSYFVVIGERPP